MNKINWLASYPKSGNTWVRIFLINLLHPDLETAVINELRYIPNAASRSLFDEYSGVNSSDLTDREIEQLRPEVFESLANSAKDQFFLKIHDVYSTLSNDKALISQEASKSIIYLIRNPLDVVVSFAKFKNISIDQMISEMEDAENALAKSNRYNFKVQLQQRLASWSEHVTSWTQQTDVPVLVIRYEDLLRATFSNFENIVAFLGLSYSEYEIKLAIQKSSFEKLKEDELRFGFKDKFATTDFFFRKGVSGEGMKELSTQQIDRVIKKHQQVMLLYDYLSEYGC